MAVSGFLVLGIWIIWSDGHADMGKLNIRVREKTDAVREGDVHRRLI